MIRRILITIAIILFNCPLQLVGLPEQEFSIVNLVSAQTCDLPISIAFTNSEAQQIPEQTRRQITNKLKQILTANGVSGDYRFSQFVMIPHVDLIDKHILPGPPAKTVMNLTISLEIKELHEGNILSAYSTDVSAVGNNENKAYAQGVKQLGNASTEIKQFIETAREKIISYYDKNSQAIINKALALASVNKTDEALYHLALVPECCTKYEEVMEVALTIYQARVDKESQQLLFAAQAVWAAGNDAEAAQRAAEYLIQIDPGAACYPQASKLLAEIKTKSSANAPWDFEMKKFDAQVELQKLKIEAAKEVGIAYGNNQQPETTNLVFAQ